MGSVNKRREIRLKREQKRRIVEVSLLIFSVLFLGGMLSAVLRVETVDFPNPMLKQAVRAKLGPGIITKTSVSKIRRMDMSNGGHEDLAGIESLWNMRRLNLSHNYVRDLTPLSGLQHITELDLSYNNVYNLEGLQGLVNLEKLNLEGNIVRDLTPLKDLPKLRELNLNYNDITSLEDVNIDALAGSPLRILRLRDNYRIEEDGTIIHLNDVSGVQGLHDLWRLDLRFNQVQDIVPIAQLNSLGMLDLRENGLSDISDLAKIRTLRKLNLRGNEIKDISPLRDLKNLTYLNLHSNIEIASIEPIKGLVEMDTLIVCNIPIGNELSCVSDMKKLRRINFRNCGIKDPQFLLDLMAEGTLQDGDKKKDRAEIDLQYNDLEYRDLAQYRQLRDYWDNVSLKAPFALPRPMNDLTVALSHPSGFYEEEFDLVITCDDPNARILYTLDGSEPDVDNIGGGKPYYVNYYKPRSWKPSEMFGPPLKERRNVTHEYTEPIRIKDRTKEPNDLSEIITTYKRKDASLLWDSPRRSTLKGNVVNVVAFNNKEYSRTKYSTYFCFKNIFELPIVSVISDTKGMFGFEAGIYVPGQKYFESGGTLGKPLSGNHLVFSPNYGKKGKYWRREAVVNLIAEGQEIKDLYYNFAIQGNFSRANLQKGLKLFSKDIDLDYNSQIIDELNTITMRAGGSTADFLRDAICSELIDCMNVGVSVSKPAIQFINGEYFGIINIKERHDNGFLSRKYGVAPDNIIMMREANSYQYTPDKVYIGENKDAKLYNDLHRYLKQKNVECVEIDDISSKIDLISFIDYHLAFLYFGNVDWNNGDRHFKLWRSRYITDNQYEDNRWRYIVWDFDRALYYLYYPTLDLFTGILTQPRSINYMRNDRPYNGRTNIFAILYEIPEFRKLFVERALMHMNDTFEPNNVIGTINRKYSDIEPELRRHEKRWMRPATTKRELTDMKHFLKNDLMFS